MEPTVVCFEGEAVIHLPPADNVTVRVELIGGRDRHSVAGQIAEGPRWWRGRVVWEDQAGVLHLDTGNEVRMQLTNGRPAFAVVEHTSADPAAGTAIRGLGTPPFEVA